MNIKAKAFTPNMKKSSQEQMENEEKSYYQMGNNQKMVIEGQLQASPPKSPRKSQSETYQQENLKMLMEIEEQKEH